MGYARRIDVKEIDRRDFRVEVGLGIEYGG